MGAKRLGALGGVSASLMLIAACQAAPPPSAEGGAKTLSSADAGRCAALRGKNLGGGVVESTEAVAIGEKGGRNLFGSSRAVVPCAYQLSSPSTVSATARRTEPTSCVIGFVIVGTISNWLRRGTGQLRWQALSCGKGRSSADEMRR